MTSITDRAEQEISILAAQASREKEIIAVRGTNIGSICDMTSLEYSTGCLPYAKLSRART